MNLINASVKQTLKKAISLPLNENLLIKGDNLVVLNELLKTHKNKIDLIYIDPPFATNKSFKIGENRTSTISNSSSDKIAYLDNLLGDEYLIFLEKRLLLLKELLSDAGSIYLGHYVKVLMDKVFGFENFKSDIARIKCNPKNFNRKAYGNIKDMILFYTKTNNPIWNEIKKPLNEEEKLKNFKKIDDLGRRYTTIPLHAPGETKKGKTSQQWKGLFPPTGRHWRCSPTELDELEENKLIEWSKNGNPRKKIFADEHQGKKIQDIWEFKDPQYPSYPTEKNLDLLKQIILNSSKSDSIVLDCFAGSGTTLIASQQLQRKWIGIDNSSEALSVINSKLSNCNNLLHKNTYNYIELI